MDTLGRAFLFVPAGIVALVAAAWLARGLGSLSAWQVRSLLGAAPGADVARGRCAGTAGGHSGSTAAPPPGSSS